MESPKPEKATGKGQNDQEVDTTPQSVRIASGGIETDQDAARFLSALIGDIGTNAVTPRCASAQVNAMGKLLKLVEMRHKYGNPEDQNRTLQLVEKKQLRDQEEKNLRRLALLRELAELEGASEKVVDKTQVTARVS